MGETCGPYTRVGQRVVFSHPENGYEHDIAEAAKLLAPGQVYTVSKVYIGGWFTELTFEEVGETKFNSVQFSPERT